MMRAASSRYVSALRRGAGARVGGGGRYDELTANFGRREPAVGFVLDLDAITDVLAHEKNFVAGGES